MKTDWILTFTGKKFFPLEPNAAEIDTLDIAHTLSNESRFGGKTREFYSVAQHSVRVAQAIWQETCNAEQALAGLFHDASEAYLRDIPSPLKYLPEFDFYRRAEKVLEAMIYAHFGLKPDDELIKRHDQRALHHEAFHLMPKHSEWNLTTDRPEDFEPFDCWDPRLAQILFLEMNRLLKNKIWANRIKTGDVIEIDEIPN